MGSGSSSSLEPPDRRRTKIRSKRKREAFERSPRDLDPRTSIRNALVSKKTWMGGTSPAMTLLVMDTENESNQANRTISTGKLHALPHFHTRPINVVVYHGSQGNSRFEVGFPLRCFQRLSRPYIAMQHCRWRDNCSTRGTFIPVLSY